MEGGVNHSSFLILFAEKSSYASLDKHFLVRSNSAHLLVTCCREYAYPLFATINAHNFSELALG